MDYYAIVSLKYSSGPVLLIYNVFKQIGQSILVLCRRMD